MEAIDKDMFQGFNTLKIGDTFVVGLPNMKERTFGVSFKYMPVVFVSETVLDLLRTDREKVMKALRIYIFDPSPEGIKKLREMINAPVGPVPVAS